MKFLKLALSVLATLLALISSAQPICGFDGIHLARMQKDSSYLKSVRATDATIREYIRKHPPVTSETLRGSSINGAAYIIPVVVHVIHTGGSVGSIYNPTDAQINGAITYLNNVYNGTYPGIEGVGDLQIQFALATRDTNCNATTGIDRIDGSSLTNYATNGVNSSNSTGVPELAVKNLDRWDPVNYYNIWVVNKIDGKDGTSGQFVAGYAYYAGAPASLDGTIMLATQMITGQKTLPHEIGHALGLFHPFEGSPDAATCPANANCNSDGDAVCDTDPITYNQTGGVVDFTCRSGINSCTGTAYSINTEKNYMNYTSCYTLFTAGQKARMQAAMSLPSRQSLVNSSAIGAYPITFTNPINASCTPVTSATGTSNYYAGLMNVGVSSKNFFSGTTKDDNGYVDKTHRCLYLIPLQKSSTYTFTATVLSANAEQVRAWIDYNNDGVFNNVTEQIYYNTNIPVAGNGNEAVVSGNFTVPASAVTGTMLRLRVTEEVAGFSLNTGCYNPTYGQAEDYPVYISLTALPVKLEYFKGVKKTPDAVLTWKTSFEENAKEFQVEKSSDGISFSLIGTVRAANIASGTNYTFTDKNITGLVNYYRLRQVDKDDKSTVSQVVEIKSGNDLAPTLKVVNIPFTDRLDVILNGIEPGSTAISLFDAVGRQVFSSNYKVMNGEILHIDVSGSGMKPGMYILRVQTGNTRFTEKLIKR